MSRARCALHCSAPHCHSSSCPCVSVLALLCFLSSLVSSSFSSRHSPSLPLCFPSSCCALCNSAARLFARRPHPLSFFPGLPSQTLPDMRPALVQTINRLSPLNKAFKIEPPVPYITSPKPSISFWSKCWSAPLNHPSSGSRP